MQVSSMAGAGATPASPGTRSSTKPSDSDAEGFAALMAFGWMGEAVQPAPAMPRFSGGEQLTAFDGERQVAEQDARQQQPGSGRQGLSQGEIGRANRQPGASASSQRISEAKPEPPAAPVSEARSGALAADQASTSAEKAATATTQAAPPLVPPASVRQMRLQGRATAEEAGERKSVRLTAVQAAEKFSAARQVVAVEKPDVGVQDAYNQKATHYEGRAGMSSASSEDKMPTAAHTTPSADTAQSGSAVARTESNFASPLVERVNQIVTAMAQSQNQQVVTRLSLEGGEEMGVVFRLRESQLEVRFLTKNNELKGALDRGWERVQTNGQRYGLRITSPVYVDPSTTDFAS